MDDVGYALAVKDLSSALSSFNSVVKIVYTSKSDSLSSENRIVISNVNVALGDSYKIRAKKISGSNSLEIEGGERGLMYGIFKLAEEVRLEKKLWSIAIEKSPEFSLRVYAEERQLLNLPSVGYHLFKPPWVNHNKDGTDIDGCNRVRISNCDINSGDDAIVLKSTLDKPCKNITISNCVLSSACIALKMVDGGSLNNVSWN